MPDITYDVGRVSFVMKGAWNLATNYEKLDAVSYNGSLYIAKQDVPGGTAITNTTYWQLAAEKGDKGDTGGVDSVNGQQGDVWFPDSRQLISDGYTTDTDPFLMKGNGSDSDRFELAKKLGNTVTVNQLVQNGNFADTSHWTALTGAVLTVSSNVGAVAITADDSSFIYQAVPHVSGRKYLIALDVKSDDFTSGYLYYDGRQIEPRSIFSSWSRLCFLVASSGGSANMSFRISSGHGAGTVYFRNWICIDLTLWFGSNDRIPSDLLSHPENWGRYYAGSLASNAGTLESADGTVLKSIGRNVFDKSTYTDAHNYIDISGLIINQTYHIMAENTSGLIQYKIATASYATAVWSSGSISGVTFTVTQEIKDTGKLWVINSSYAAASVAQIETAKVCLSLYYPGESGYDQYYPYTVLAEVDTGSESLLGYDWKEPNGTIHRETLPRIDMGTLAVAVYSSGLSIFRVNVSGRKYGRYNLMCSKYAVSTANAKDNLADKEIIGYEGENSYVYFRDTAYSGYTEAQIQAALSGVMLECESATPTTEQGTAFAPIVATVKGGVLSWTQTKGIPVGQESHWFENLRKRVEDRLPDTPSADGTYRLTCTISGGVKTYSWEA